MRCKLDSPEKKSFARSLWRSLALRCPRCGETKLFRTVWRMHEVCDNCQLKYEREPGFFLGTIYFNYGLTSLVAATVYPIATFGLKFPRTPTIIAIVAFVVLFPLWFFRYARSLWIGFDQLVDPRESES